MNSHVIDLSHWNTVPKDLKEAAKAGVWGCIHKLTEGTGYTDPKVTARYALAKDAHMLWGLYHFVRPGDIDLQAQFFSRQAESLNVVDDNTLIAVDYEDERVDIAQLVEFVAAVEALFERSCVLYSGHVLKEALQGQPNLYLAPCRLWLAQYASAPVLPPGWNAYWLWQWTDKGEVPGIQPPVDCNDYQGAQADLEIEWSGRAEPSPVPPAEEPVVRVIVPAGVQVKVLYER